MTASRDLTDLLAQYDIRESDRENSSTDAHALSASAASVFPSLSETVIRPVLAEIGEQLQAHGHLHAIRDQERAHGHDARITFEVLPSRYPEKHYTAGNRPWIAFVQVSPGSPITVWRSMIMPGTAGGNGWVGSYAPEHVTPELVHGLVIEWLTLILR